MNISAISPNAQHYETFSRNRCKFVPQCSGCYVLTTFTNVVLYVGLAKNLRARMSDHLNDPEKNRETPLGRAVLFHWLETNDTLVVERTWMNIHVQHEGKLPILNTVYSPVSV
jgi:excinuclease UvrABC nuclease subunit